MQQELGRRGYQPGVADGTPGLVTRAAVMAYEHDQGLPLTADPSPEVLAHLRHGTSAPGAAIGLEANAPRTTGSADQVIRAVQQAAEEVRTGVHRSANAAHGAEGEVESNTAIEGE